MCILGLIHIFFIINTTLKAQLAGTSKTVVLLIQMMAMVATRWGDQIGWW